MAGNVVIVIDALDKSGGDTSLKDILRLFRSAAVTKLPCNLRILLTSRPESDICKKLNDVSHIKSWSVDDTESTTRDIRSIKSSWLRMICAAVFPVDRLACDFIRSQHSFFFITRDSMLVLLADVNVRQLPAVASWCGRSWQNKHCQSMLDNMYYEKFGLYNHNGRASRGHQQLIPKRLSTPKDCV